jgi:Ser/Thr protein kinase RdoA (MazF antagonist)
VAAALALLDDAKARVPETQRTLYAALRDELARAEDCNGLPECLIHPDFVPANVITSPGAGAVLVDWTGAGRGPRLWSLTFLLWAAGGGGSGCIDAVVAGYRRHVELEPAELERLAGAIGARPLIFTCWGFWTGGKQLPEVIQRLSKIHSRAEAIAARAVAGLG